MRSYVELTWTDVIWGRVVKSAFCFASALALLAASQAGATTYTAGRSAPWLQQIQLPSNAWAGTDGGKGIIIGIVDTGVVSTNSELTGRVSSLSSCVAVSFKCSNGVMDDNGHGTAVASIAAGYALPGGSLTMSGVAPGATILAEKALSAAGSGVSTDAARGIIAATNGGAQVINLSLTYLSSADVVQAIDYAASKGVVIVWAGGNDNKALNGGSNTYGLTNAALTHMIVVGSVDSANAKSSFSNTPGTANAVGQSQSATYSSLWLMAPGEKIIAPCTQSGATSYCYWSGTSMAAPVVAGSVALLEKTWPVLVRNGTATKVLFVTATDLGAAGVDSTFGNGLMNLTKAFSPIGEISAVSATGKSITLGGSTNGTLSASTLGSLKALGSALSSYTIFDSYSRNFTANLSKLISTPTGSTASLSSLVYTPIWTNTTALAGGALLSVTRDPTPTLGQFSDDRAAFGLMGMLPHAPVGYVAFANVHGLTMSGGFGLSSISGFGDALWGARSAEAESVTALGGSTALLSLAQGGYSASVGAPVGSHTRFAASWSSTLHDRNYAAPFAMASRQADAISFGVTTQATSRLTVGMTLSSLNERNGLLGASYTSASVVNFGDQHKSLSTSLSAVFDLGGGASLAFDAADVSTPARNVASGILARVSNLHAQAYGASLTLTNLLARADRFTVSVRQPLQLSSGSVDVAQTTVDEDGYNHTALVRTSIADSHTQTDFGLGYGRRISSRAQFRGDIAFRTNVNGVAGLDDVAGRAVMQLRF